VVVELRKVPDDALPLYDGCCDEGQSLFVEWADAKIGVVSSLRELSGPWGISGLSAYDAEVRAVALTGLSPVGALDIYRTEDYEMREAKIHAVIAASRSGAPGLDSQAAGQELTCPGCGVRFVAQFDRQQYCSASCRKRASRRRLASTDVEE
jgi:hypothetical protein